MSKLETNQVDPATGTTLTLGTSGDTISIPSGVTIANSGTASGFGATLKPAFHANNTSNPTWTINTHTKIAFTNENFDTNSAYDTSTSRFTVPAGEGGKYYIGSTVQLYGTNDFYELFARVYVNGAAENQLSLRVRYKTANTLDANYNQNYYIGGIRILSAADYIEVYGMVNAASGDSAINQQSTFFAYKLFD